MRRFAAALLAIAPVALLLLVAGPARAEATFESATVENGYPKSLVFKLKASATAQITDVTLKYSVLGRSGGIVKPDEFTPGTSVDLSATLDTNPDTDWLPAGNDIVWSFELTLADGTKATSPEQQFTYLPPDKNWKTVENDIARIYYSGDRASLAQKFLDAIEGVYEKHGQQLLHADVPRKPVKVLIMANNQELKEASPSKGTTLDNSQAVITCGFRPGNANDIIFGTISCGGADPIDTVRHEFGHILNASAGEGTLVKLPVWLDEGLAVYAQENPDEYTGVFSSAVRRKALIPFRQMGTSIAGQNQIILQYGEGYAMVKYLIDTYGDDKLRELMGRTKANTRFDEALEATYNFDLNGFEEEFLAAVGGGTTQPTAQPTTRPAQQPTVAPTQQAGQRGQDQAAGTSDDGGGLSNTAVIVIVAAVLLALLGLFSLLLLIYFQNQRKGRGPAAP